MEELMYDFLIHDPVLVEVLARFAGKPAVFYHKSPNDEDENWEKPCYPRMDFTVNRLADPQRKTAGTVEFSLWVSNECGTQLGEDLDQFLEKRLMFLLHGAFFTQDGVTTATQWRRSDAFSLTVSKTTLEASTVEVFGLEVCFDLVEFPSQIGSDPDPVLGVNAWLKREFPSMKVIEFDVLPPVWKASDDQPAVYCRYGGMESSRENYSVCWYLGQFAFHVFADSVTERNRWVKVISEGLRVAGEVVLEDESPMFVQKLSVRLDGDPLKVGQLTLLGEYGVLASRRKERACFPVNRVRTREG